MTCHIKLAELEIEKVLRSHGEFIANPTPDQVQEMINRVKVRLQLPQKTKKGRQRRISELEWNSAVNHLRKNGIPGAMAFPSRRVQRAPAQLGADSESDGSDNSASLNTGLARLDIRFVRGSGKNSRHSRAIRRGTGWMMAHSEPRDSMPRQSTRVFAQCQDVSS